MNETKLKPMDLTPSWETCVKIAILTLETVKDEEAKKIARKEIIRLARAVDEAQAKEKGGAS